MAWADGRIGWRDVARNWAVVGVANAVGAAGLALLVAWSGLADGGNGAVGATAQRIALAKAALPPGEAFVRGILCNLLVCMAVWMSLAGRSVVDKAVAVVFPVTGFVAAGFEHSIANLYYFPLAALLGAPLTAGAAFAQLGAVIAGNLVGGSVLVALVYWLIYVRPARRAGSTGLSGLTERAD
jgi:formate transporter